MQPSLIFSNQLIFVPLIAILLLAVFTGAYVVYLGFRKRRSLRGYVKLPASIERIYYPSFAASIAWSYKGIRYYGLHSGVYALTKKDRVNILLHPHSMESNIDIWTHNGKGKILGGFLIGFLGGLSLILLVLTR